MLLLETLVVDSSYLLQDTYVICMCVMLSKSNCLWITTTNLHMHRSPYVLAFLPLFLHDSQKWLCPWFVASLRAQVIRHCKTEIVKLKLWVVIELEKKLQFEAIMNQMCQPRKKGYYVCLSLSLWALFNCHFISLRKTHFLAYLAWELAYVMLQSSKYLFFNLNVSL